MDHRVAVLVGVWLLTAAGCATHADFLEMRDHVSAMSRLQEQDRQRMDAVLRRIESVERAKDIDPARQRFDEVVLRLQKIEHRLVRVEESLAQAAAKPDHSSADSRPSKTVKQAQAAEPLPAGQGITPTAAFNLAYNDYLNGKYELAAAGFQRFVKDFPGTSLTPNAQYWLGESYFNLKDYGRAIQTFEVLVAEYPGSEKAPAALYKLGLATAETGDLPKSKKSLRRVLEEFPSSDEARLAKYKLAELR